jgi:uncharacterized protein YggT (Ycf19 family)
MDADFKVKGLRFAKVVAWLAYAYFIAATIILTLAFFLLLFNASTTASFTQWVYRSANRVLEPFRGIFPSVTNGNGSVIDFAVVFAIIMYGILALVIHALVTWLDRQILRNQAEIRKAAAEGNPPEASY